MLLLADIKNLLTKTVNSIHSSPSKKGALAFFSNLIILSILLLQYLRYEENKSCLKRTERLPEE